MPQTLQNGIQTPINADAYNLTADLATMGGKSNVVIQVANATAMNALTATAGMCCARLDIPGAPVWTYDGTVWAGPGGVTVLNLTFATGFGADATVAVPAVYRDSGRIYLQGGITNTNTTTMAANSTINIAQIPNSIYYPKATVLQNIRVRSFSDLSSSFQADLQITTGGVVGVMINPGRTTPSAGSTHIYIDGISWIAQ